MFPSLGILAQRFITDCISCSENNIHIFDKLFTSVGNAKVMQREASQSISQDICDRAQTQLRPLMPRVKGSSFPSGGRYLLRTPQMGKSNPLFNQQVPLLPPSYTNGFSSASCPAGTKESH